jgi:predicted lipoprotein with Yx(FWY)xxD motif
VRSPATSILGRPLGIGLVGVVGLLGLAACGDDDSDDDSAPAETSTTTDASTTTDDAASTDGGTTVETTTNDLGTILVDSDGNTLYAFVPDEQGPSTCVDACASNWPAVAAPAEAGEGVDAALLDEAARPDDGSAQATYNGWPLYYFAGDAAPGETNGQGVNDVWFVIDPAGSLIGAG